MRNLRIGIVLLVMLTLVAGFGFATGQGEGDGEVFIPVVSKGLQHQFWQTVKSGAEAAAEDYDVAITFEGPASEADIQDQVQMLQNALAKNPDAIALAALDTNAVRDQLQEAVRRDIPIIGFDSGVPNAPEGSIFANASTDNYAAAGLGADMMFTEVQDDIESASADSPVTIVVMNQDASGESLLSRGRGFRDRMIDLIISETDLSADDIQVTGNPAYVADDSPQSDSPTVIIDMVVPASPRTQDATAAANAVFNRIEDDNIVGIFSSNEGTVVGILAATNDGSELASRYDDVVVVGFDAGEAQKNAVREQYFLGSITQDPYQIGYKAVELAYQASQGDSVADVDTGAKFYNYENMDDSDIANLLYD
ncbi:MAG: ABC transporter substrate-binding protein [Spirochaetales bacterium]